MIQIAQITPNTFVHSLMVIYADGSSTYWEHFSVDDWGKKLEGEALEYAKDKNPKLAIVQVACLATKRM